MRPNSKIRYGLVAFATLALCPWASADVLVTKDGARGGRVAAFDKVSILFEPGCDPAKRESVWWEQVSRLVVEDGCAVPGSLTLPSNVTSCAGRVADGFEVHFRESQAAVLASAITLRSDSKMRLVSFPEQDLLVGPKRAVSYIDGIKLCSPSASSAQNYPSGYCVDPMQVAVNWSVTPVFNNQIFTKGSSIYVQVIGSLRGLTEEDIRAAYNTALSAWAIALQDARSSLDPELQKYVHDSTARSAKFQLFTPPQVLRMRCIDNALAVVRWYGERQDVFPPDRSDYVAMAQVEGRTVLLNANDTAFGVVRGNQDLATDEVSLVAVFVHELGHSFGMPDRPHSAEPSVMDQYYVFTHIVKGYLAPTSFDTQVFAVLLKKSIAGAAPGVLNATDCAGLRRPKERSISPLQQEFRPQQELSSTRTHAHAIYRPPRSTPPCALHLRIQRQTSTESSSGNGSYRIHHQREAIETCRLSDAISDARGS